MKTADIHSQLQALISSCIDEGDYDPAEDYIKDPFCRRTMHTASLAINEIDTLRARVDELEAAAAHLACAWTAQHVINTDLDRRVVNMIMVWDRPRFDAAIAESARAANGEGGVMETLGEALPKEIARVRDDVMPAYIAIGPPGQFALAMMRAALDAASKAMIEGDTVAMIAAYQELKGFES